MAMATAIRICWSRSWTTPKNSTMAQSHVILWINDGYDFVSSDRFVLDSEEERFPLPTRRATLGRSCEPVVDPIRAISPKTPWQLTRPWAAIEEPPLFFEAAVNPCALHPHLIADLDGNGTVDLLGSPERINTFPYRHRLLWLSPVASGRLRRDGHAIPCSTGRCSWRTGTTASDLNDDGVLDVAYGRWQLDRRSGARWCGSASATAHPSSKATTPCPVRAVKCSPAMSTAMATPIWSCWE